MNEVKAWIKYLRGRIVALEASRQLSEAATYRVRLAEALRVKQGIEELRARQPQRSFFKEIVSL